jgi:hypothetical protein
MPATPHEKQALQGLPPMCPLFRTGQRATQVVSPKIVLAQDFQRMAPRCIRIVERTLNMKILKPGKANQSANRKAATEYIASNIFDAETVDTASGQFTTTDGDSYQVFAFADTPGAFVSTPNVENSRNSIYSSGVPAIMFRQLKHDKRSFVYEIDPLKVFVKPNSSTAEWTDISKVARRIWICTSDEVRLIDKIAKNS